MMEQPREPIFYPDETKHFFAFGNDEETLQSIDSTLKRIEKLFIQMRNQSFASDGSALSGQK